MNNFFLYNQSLNAASISQLEKGFSNLILVKSISKPTDSFWKHESVWTHNTGYGTIVELFYSVISEGLQRILPAFLASVIDYDMYINNETDFDILFENDCNGFNGIDFSSTNISQCRKVFDTISFESFRISCAEKNAFRSITDFWENKHILFPQLIFCESVLAQIRHLSCKDDRFKLIIQKLKKLNGFTKSWTEGVFDYKTMGLDCSPDAPKRIRDTLQQRTFNCVGIGDKIFSLHIKWYFQKEVFRLYFYPESTNHKVYIGYIGDKDGIGFD